MTRSSLQTRHEFAEQDFTFNFGLAGTSVASVHLVLLLLWEIHIKHNIREQIRACGPLFLSNFSLSNTLVFASTNKFVDFNSCDTYFCSSFTKVDCHNKLPLLKEAVLHIKDGFDNYYDITDSMQSNNKKRGKNDSFFSYKDFDINYDSGNIFCVRKEVMKCQTQKLFVFLQALALNTKDFKEILSYMSL